MSLPSFSQRIIVRHPGYFRNNIILALPACDGANAVGQAHYPTVHTACAIIANNCRDGWLSSSSSGQPRTCADANDLIPAGTYYFHVECEPMSVPYPVVPTFRTWVFPHEDLPPLWLQSVQSGATFEGRTAIETCRLTNKRLACENAHIIPAAEKSWYGANGMSTYCDIGRRAGQDVADHPMNSMRLRRDVHSLWDGMFFSIVPKRSHKAKGDEIRWHVHSMLEDEELLADYHNRTTESLTGRPVEYFYARFAWDIFPRILGFLQTTEPRRLAVCQPNGEVEIRSFSIQECKGFTEGQGRGRSASPTKKRRGLDGAEYGKGAEGGVQSAEATKRRRHGLSSRGFTGVDPAISEIDDKSDTDDSLVLSAAKTPSFWDLMGWPVEQEQDHDYDDESEIETLRGRKRHRDVS